MRTRLTKLTRPRSVPSWGNWSSWWRPLGGRRLLDWRLPTVVAVLAMYPLPPQPPDGDTHPGAGSTLEAQREALFAALADKAALSPPALEHVRQVFSRSRILGQGNPRLSEHPIDRQQCAARLEAQPSYPADPQCGAANMVVLYDAARESAADAHVCIDQFEFPNLPCEYPVVHVRANEAAELCSALGKRLCDAHEWEGACAGALHPSEAEYAWGHERREMRAWHNARREVVWAYGSAKNHALCATSSAKSPGCPGSGYERCGSNTMPSGSFPACVSPLGVYDLHGNVAEHMNLPLVPAELGSTGGKGVTEMKGSWFVFGRIDAHPDDCRWRAPDWHASRVDDPRSHSNYHLGFRCCKDL